MSRALAGTASVAASGITSYGIVRANGDFELPEIEVKLPKQKKSATKSAASATAP